LAAKEVRPVGSFARRRLGLAATGLLGMAVLLCVPTRSGADAALPINPGPNDPAVMLLRDYGGQRDLLLALMTSAPVGGQPFSPYPAPFRQRRSYFGDGLASSGF
jgi:hypothetical protein